MAGKYKGKSKSKIKARLLKFGHGSRSDLIFLQGCFTIFRVDFNSHTIIQDPAQLKSELPCRDFLAHISRLSGLILKVHVFHSLTSRAVSHRVSDPPFQVDHFGRQGLAWMLREYSVKLQSSCTSFMGLMRSGNAQVWSVP